MRGVALRMLAWAVMVGLVFGACTTAETSPTTTATPPSPSTTDTAPPGSALESTPVPSAEVTTTEPAASATTTTRSDRVVYVVVAEEEAGRLAIFEPAGPCVDEATSSCEVPVRLRVDLPERPHNLAAVDGVVFVSHPAAGSISRVDLATGSIVTSVVGTEPHDIKYAPSTRLLYVTDESGRRLLTVDPDTLQVLETVDLPAEPHDLAVVGDVIWVTLVGRSSLARVSGGEVEIISTGGLPHDLIVAVDGRVWFTNWGLPVLSVFDPETGSTVRAPAGVAEPHHFALAPDGAVWVSDNGGSSIVGFTEPQVAVEVGPVPHHLAFVGDTVVVAVSGSGQAVQVRNGRVVGRTQLTPGLHGVAVIEVAGPLGE
ncbi:MAG: hypothetical protein V3V29_10455 [Acidimicrobiia bacterium]